MHLCVLMINRDSPELIFLEKKQTLATFERLCQQLLHEKGKEFGKIVRIQSDHGREFLNSIFF